MSQPSAPFQVTSSFGKERRSRTCGFVSVSTVGEAAAVRPFAGLVLVAVGSGSAHTSRGVTESSRRNTSVPPFRSIEGAPFTSGPLVSAATFPSSVARYTCPLVPFSAGKSTDPLSGAQVRPEPPRPPTRSSRDALRVRGAPPEAGTTET